MAYSIQELMFHSGDLFLPKSVRKYLEIYWIGNDTSLFYVTNWSFLHFLSGILTVKLLKYLNIEKNIVLVSFLVHCVWELWQMIGKKTLYWTTRGQIDVITDTVFFMAGVYLTLKLQ